MKRFFNSIIILFSSLLALAQGSLAIGQWQDHLPYQQGISVTQSDEKVIYSTGLSVFSIDKAEGSVTFLSKVNGLSDIGIEKVRYDSFNDQLFIIYENSNIDIVKGDQVINVANIKATTSITSNKKVNDIFFFDGQTSYFAADFGIISFNNQDYNFGSTILTGVRINQIAQKGNIVYAASEEGVYYIDLQLENNIADFSQWKLLGSEEGLPSLYDAKSVVNHKGSIYIGAESSLYKENSDLFSWSELYSADDLEIQFISTSEDRLGAGWRGDDFQSDVLFFDDKGEFLSSGMGCTGVPEELIVSEDGRVWYADLFSRIRMSSGYDDACTQTFYNSPFSDKVSDIVIKEDEVLVASGGVAENFTFLFSREGFYYNGQEDWINFNEINNAAIAERDLLNVYRVAFHPSLSKLYAGSYWAGLLEYDLSEDSYTLFNKENSSLRGALGDEARERVSGLAFDQEENLWVTTYGAPEALHVLSSDGTWQSINTTGPKSLTDIIIDDDGYKWMPVDGSSAGILVYDSGPSIQSISDDQFRLISSNTSELTTNEVLCAAVDRDGAVWVGTSEGPVIFDCGSDVFDPTRCEGVRRKLLQDNDGAFLLADQQINAIAIDGADRKWFGTRSGLFVQSPQGDEQINHFTSENSPLLDDVITALTYDGQAGIMWIGTNKGLISFRTESTFGENIHRSDRVYAFPNPVEPHYDGPVAIKGLVDNANVKITDVNGILVTELDALGGQAIWDRKDLKGRLVNSGVYLVFSTDQEAFDSPDSFVTKIMILR